jgi:ParB family chromosome partitioning protein
MVTTTLKQQIELDVKMIPIREIVADKNIREVDKKSEKFKELVLSVKEKGVLMPALVRPFAPSGYQLVDGYFRLYAAQAAGLDKIPVRIKAMTDGEMIEIQLIGNLQRQDMNALEEARAFKLYLDTTKATQQVLAQKIGKSQPYVANRIRLLNLPKNVVKLVEAGELSTSHAEVLGQIPKEAPDLLEDALAMAMDEYEPPSVKELAEEVKWRLNDFEESKKQAAEAAEQKKKAAEEFAKRLEAATNKACPKKGCGKPAAEWDPRAKVLRCAKYHGWNPATGKLDADTPDKDDEDFEDTLPSPSRRSTVQKKIAAPSEPKTFRSFHAAAVMGKQLIKDLADAQITRVNVSKDYNGGHEVRIFVTKMAEKNLQFVAEPHPYSSGEKSRVEIHAYDDRRRKEMRTAFENWAKKALPKISLKPKAGKEADPKILEGSIDKIAKKLPKDLEQLESLRAFEMKGKKRTSLLQLMDLRLSIR